MNDRVFQRENAVPRMIQSLGENTQDRELAERRFGLNDALKA